MVAASKRLGGVGGTMGGTIGGTIGGMTGGMMGGDAATLRARACSSVACTSGTRAGPKAGDMWPLPALWTRVAARACMPDGSVATVGWRTFCWDMMGKKEAEAGASGR